MRDEPKARPCRYRTLDIHKHYSVVGGVNRDREETLAPRRMCRGDIAF